MNSKEYNQIYNTKLDPTLEDIEIVNRKERDSFDNILFVIEGLRDNSLKNYEANKYRPFRIVKNGKLTRTGRKNLSAAYVLNKNGEASTLFKLLSDCYEFSVLSADECVYMLSLVGADVSLFGGLRVGWDTLSDEVQVLATLIMAERWYPGSKIVRWTDLPLCKEDGKNVTMGYTQHYQMNINTTVVDYCEMLAAKS